MDYLSTPSSSCSTTVIATKFKDPHLPVGLKRGFMICHFNKEEDYGKIYKPPYTCYRCEKIMYKPRMACIRDTKSDNVYRFPVYVTTFCYKCVEDIQDKSKKMIGVSRYNLIQRKCLACKKRTGQDVFDGANKWKDQHVGWRCIDCGVFEEANPTDPTLSTARFFREGPGRMHFIREMDARKSTEILNAIPLMELLEKLPTLEKFSMHEQEEGYEYARRGVKTVNDPDYPMRVYTSNYPKGSPSDMNFTACMKMVRQPFMERYLKFVDDLTKLILDAGVVTEIQKVSNNVEADFAADDENKHSYLHPVQGGYTWRGYLQDTEDGYARKHECRCYVLGKPGGKQWFLPSFLLERIYRMPGGLEEVMRKEFTRGMFDEDTRSNPLLKSREYKKEANKVLRNYAFLEPSEIGVRQYNKRKAASPQRDAAGVNIKRIPGVKNLDVLREELDKLRDGV